MMRSGWRDLAFALVAATLSVGIAACDDDTSKTHNDMAVGGGGADMSANAVDMAAGTPGNAQVTLADIVGTAYNGASAIPRVHILTALASFSKIAGTPDPSSDFTLGPPPHGCSVYRYDVGAGKVPGADADAGPVSMSGYSTSVIGTDTKTGLSAPPKGSITCVRGGPLMTYNCFYGMMPDFTDGGSAGMGALTGDIIYAPFNQLTPATCPGDFFPDPNGGVRCEQYPIQRGGFATISETIGGGADYPATNPAVATIGTGKGEDAGAMGLADQVTIVSVKSGATEISGNDPISGGTPAATCPGGAATSPRGCQRNLDLKDGMIDKTTDLTIQWSCDGSQTAGSGCTGTSDFLGVLLTTSTHNKGTFSTPQSTAFGVGQCVELVGKAGSTATVKAAQLQALIGGQTGGSLQLAVVRLAYKISPSGTHLIVYTAGHGQFGFTNLP